MCDGEALTLRVCLQSHVPNPSPSFSARTLFKLLNSAFFAKSFYTKVALKNQINPFFLKKISKYLINHVLMDHSVFRDHCSGWEPLLANTA